MVLSSEGGCFLSGGMGTGGVGVGNAGKIHYPGNKSKVWRKIGLFHLLYREITNFAREQERVKICYRVVLIKPKEWQANERICQMFCTVGDQSGPAVNSSQWDFMLRPELHLIDKVYYLFSQIKSMVLDWFSQSNKMTNTHLIYTIHLVSTSLLIQYIWHRSKCQYSSFTMKEVEKRLTGCKVFICSKDKLK